MSNRIILVIVILLPVTLFLYLNYLDLIFEEPRRALVSMEMILSGDYITPQINGAPYYNKPPLFNWLIAGLFKLSGTYDNWLVRLPSILSVLLTAFFNFKFVSKYINRQTALLSSLFFVTSADIFFFETLVGGEMDLFYTLLVYLQVISIYHFYQQKNYLLLFVVSYLLMSTGVLTKGMPSFLFQGLTLVLMVAWQRDWKMLFRWQHLAGIMVFILSVGGYLYMYNNRQGDVALLAGNLLNESTSKSGLGVDQHKVVYSVFTFPIQLIRFLAPWSLLAVFYFRRRNFININSFPLLIFCILFILVNIPPYWFTATVKSRYIYMFFPFLCILIGYAWLSGKDNYPRLNKWIGLFFFWLMIAVSCSYMVLPFLKVTAEISHVLLKSLGLFLLSGLVCFLYYKWQEQRIYLFILFVVLLRGGMTFYYFPLYRANKNGQLYASVIAKKITEVVKTEPVYLIGKPVKAVIGPVIFNRVIITTPPFLDYGISFYYSKYSGRILQYSDSVVADSYCIFDEDNFNLYFPDKDNMEIAFDFSKGKGMKYYLVRPKK